MAGLAVQRLRKVGRVAEHTVAGLASRASPKIGIRHAWNAGLIIPRFLPGGLRFLFQGLQRKADALSFLVNFKYLEVVFVAD